MNPQDFINHNIYRFSNDINKNKMRSRTLHCNHPFLPWFFVYFKNVIENLKHFVGSCKVVKNKFNKNKKTKK